MMAGLLGVGVAGGRRGEKGWGVGVGFYFFLFFLSEHTAQPQIGGARNRRRAAEKRWRSWWSASCSRGVSSVRAAASARPQVVCLVVGIWYTSESAQRSRGRCWCNPRIPCVKAAYVHSCGTRERGEGFISYRGGCPLNVLGAGSRARRRGCWDEPA